MERTAEARQCLLELCCNDAFWQALQDKAEGAGASPNCRSSDDGIRCSASDMFRAELIATIEGESDGNPA